jgi:hypothetical protein
MAVSSSLRRLAFGASLATGIGLVGAAAYGVTSLDGPLADAAQRQQLRQQSEQVVRMRHDGPCPRHFRAPSQSQHTRVTL